MRRASDEQSGYIVFILVLFVSIAAMTMSAALLQSATGTRTIHSAKIRSIRYLEVEGSVARTLSWMRLNSQKLVSPFRQDEFYTLMRRVATPTVGSNDTTTLPVASRIQLAGTSNAVILSNDAGVGTALFPTTRDISTGVTFDAVADFQSATLGDAIVKVTLIDVIAKEPATDFGNPPNPAPGTDFYPVYRIDAMSALDRGTHISTIVRGDVVNQFDMGFYGEDYLELRQPCDAYRSGDGAYGGTNHYAHCLVGSNSTAAVHKNEEIYGGIKTNGSIDADPPFGGEACADFTAGCPNKGETCSGEDCGVPLLEDYDPWTTYCPSDQGALVISADTTLTVPSNNPSDNCWDTVTIQAGTTLTLTTTAYEYYFREIILAHNTSIIEVLPDTAGEAVTTYTNLIDGDNLNGNQAINANGKPNEWILIYLGTNTLTLNGNADMHVALVAPNAEVNISGNFDYFGALLSKRLILQGTGDVHYDEDLNGYGKVVDVQFRMMELVQNYE